MKLHITKEWMEHMIREEPDDASCEAGIMHPEAPRFRIEHGLIHDRASGKHVRTDEFEDGILGALAILNDLDQETRRLYWQNKFLETELDHIRAEARNAALEEAAQKAFVELDRGALAETIRDTIRALKTS